MPFEFEANAAEDTNQPVPDGDYYLRVIDAEESVSKKTGYDMIVLDLVFTSGQYEDRPFGKHWLTFIPKGRDGHGMTLHALHAFGFPHDGRIKIGANDFKGRTVKVKIGAEAYQGRNRNKIQDFYVLGEEAMSKEMFPAEPVAAAASPTNAQRPLPWAKK